MNFHRSLLKFPVLSLFASWPTFKRNTADTKSEISVEERSLLWESLRRRREGPYLPMKLRNVGHARKISVLGPVPVDAAPRLSFRYFGQPGEADSHRNVLLWYFRIGKRGNDNVAFGNHQDPNGDEQLDRSCRQYRLPKNLERSVQNVAIGT